MSSDFQNRSLRIALLTHAGTGKAAQICEALRAKKVRISLFVFEGRKPLPISQRLLEMVAEEGFASLIHKFVERVSLVRRLIGTASTAPGQSAWPPANVYAVRTGVRVLALPDLTSAASLGRLKAEKIDLFIHAGAGILRSDILAIPRLGTLNAHMGVLPAYRGMNVAEWAALNGDPIGCTIHLIDPGIDTGGIIANREVSLDGICSLAELRARVDATQLAALSDIVANIASTGSLPPIQTQKKEEGKQYFTMHKALRTILEARLASNSLVQEYTPTDHSCQVKS